MKKVLQIILFSMVTSVGRAQVYHPIPTDSVHWLEERASCNGSGCCYWFYDHIFPSGIVVIKGTSYTKLLCNENFILMAPDIQCSQTNTFYNLLYGFFRNDSINKKVYWYDSLYNQEELLLYNFNLAIGDTVSPRPGSFTGDPNDTIIVTDIDSIDIGGAFRKSYAINSITGSNYTDTIIEGVGSKISLFYHCYSMFPCYYYGNSHLICYHYKNYEYTPDGPNCDFGIGINESPQPNNQFITLVADNFYNIENSDNASIQITCYDLLGKFVLEKSFHESGYLDFTEVPAGIYFMYIVYNGQIVKPYKFIVQH